VPPIRVAIIGAGPCGLTSAKALAEAGITDLVMFDRGQRVGGNWVFDDASGHSSVFETTHIISSRRYSSFSDHAFPEGTPDYPSHREVAAYFESYAERFDLHRYLRPSTLVLRCTPRPEGGFVVRWRSEIDHSEHEEAFDKLVVANGHHWLPRWPDYPGTFSGEVLHSHDYKRAAPFTGRRVLVIGGGNSACDIAVETSRVSERTEISWRRGYWIVPKFVFGWAADDLNHAIAQRLGWIPLAWRLKALEVAVKLLTGGHGRYGLAAPDHPLGATHPTVNSELLYALRHGKITPRPDIERLWVDGALRQRLIGRVRHGHRRNGLQDQSPLLRP
jgi:cation diffusion facilitator CzcD-associated flavoprotein CzcO